MPLYTYPLVPHDDFPNKQIYQTESYHMLIEEEFSVDSFTKNDINYIMNSKMCNYVTIRCKKRHITCLMCVSRSFVVYDSKRMPDLQIIRIEVDKSHRGKGYFKEFIGILEEISKRSGRCLQLIHISSERMFQIMKENSMKFFRYNNTNNFIMTSTI